MNPIFHEPKGKMKQSVPTFWIPFVKKDSFGKPRKKIKSCIKLGKITVVPYFLETIFNARR